MYRESYDLSTYSSIPSGDEHFLLYSFDKSVYMQNSRTVRADDATEHEPGTTTPNESFKATSRLSLLEELASLGFKIDQYSECTIEQLQDLVRGAKWLHRTYDGTADSSEDSDEDDHTIPTRISDSKKESVICFTEVDKKVLKSLLDSSGRVSSLALSRKLGIPLTTVQRRRKRLEGEYLEVSYSLRLEKLGWRKADFLISTYKGMTSSVGKEILNHNSVTRVSKAIGEHTIDLHVESVFKNNKELLNVIEWLKSLEGVKDVVWTEPVEMIGRNNSVQYEIIDKHL